jgi:hypothetical protein
MKNLLLLSAVLLLTLNISAQTHLRSGGSFYGLGKQQDTLIASQTLNYDLKIGNEVFGVMNLGLESDSVSGTPAYSAYLQESLKENATGTEWTNLDTITHTGGADHYEEFSAVNVTHGYYRISIVATATAQKSLFKAWGRLNEGFVIQQ